MPFDVGNSIDIFLTEGVDISPVIQMPVATGLARPIYRMTVPDGLSFNRATRELSGAPTQRGKFLHRYAAVRNDDLSVLDVRFMINPASIPTASRVISVRNLDDCIFFGYPENYRNIEGQTSEVQKVCDNDFATFSEETSYPIVLTEDYTHIFIKCKNSTRFAIGSNPAESVNSYITNHEGNRVDIDPDGFQNILHPVSGSGDVTITFTGTEVKVYEIMVLKELLRLDSNARFTNISYKMSDRSSILQKDIADRITKISGLNQDRWKWDLSYTSLFTSEDLYHERNSKYNQLINFISNRENNNFVISGEYTRYPSRVYPATFPDPEVQVNFLSRFKGSGEEIVFNVMEL